MEILIILKKANNLYLIIQFILTKKNINTLQFMKVNFKILKDMDKEKLNGKMELNMKENGKMAN